MAARVTLIGQGIAGSMLAWGCERAGIEFEIIDAGHAAAGSRVGAGLVSPVAGRRLVPTWRFAEWRAEALRIYRELEGELSVPLVRELRLRRVYRDAAERARFEARIERPEVAPWVESADADGLWLRGAIQADTRRLGEVLRERWRQQGRLREAEVGAAELADRERVIWCVGAQARTAGIAWEVSKGEVVEGTLGGLEPDVVLNDGKWIMPMEGDRVRVGATFGREDLAPVVTAGAQADLVEAARRLTGRELGEPRGLAGLRVTVPDRRPVVGWRDAAGRCGVFGALAAKGALWAPVLAQQWLADDLRGAQIDVEARVNRFVSQN